MYINRRNDMKYEDKKKDGMPGKKKK